MRNLAEVLRLLKEFSSDLDDKGEVLDEETTDTLNEIIFEVNMIIKDFSKGKGE
jgi:hypothetical protein